MRLCTIVTGDGEQAAVVTAHGIVPVPAINAHLGKAWATDLYSMIACGLSPQILLDAEATPVKLAAGAVRLGPLYRPPRQRQA